MEKSNPSCSNEKNLEFENHHVTMDMGGDRISRLPDNILHHMLSFLDMIYVVHTSVLSKRWRYLWTSLPFLNFDNQIFNYFTSRVMENGERAFMDFVDHVFRVRDNSGIQRFHLSYYDDGFLPSSFNSWIVYAVQHSVQELDLKVYSGEAVTWPNCLFTCKSLKKLKLNICDEWRHQFHLPDSINLPSLQILHLELLCFVDEKLTSKLFSSCPILESLIVENCDVDSLQDLIISAPKLRRLIINSYLDDELSFIYEESIPNGCKIQIYAPGLTSFVCKDFIFREHHLHNCSSLVEADIDLQLVEYYEYDHDPETSRKHLAVNKEVYGQRIIGCLEGVSNVEALTLSASLLKFVSEPPSVLESLPTQFCNLWYFKLEICLSNDSIGAIIHLLKISPSIKNLVVDLKEICHTEHPLYPYWDEKKINSEILEEHREAGLSLHHLKFVKMQNILGSINELKLLKVLLEVAPVMEKIVVSTLMMSSPDREKMAKFSETLSMLPRASSSLVILHNLT